MEENTNSDTKKHLLLPYSAVANMLSAFDYPVKTVHDEVRGYRQTRFKTSTCAMTLL
jgi:hypothetical protein